MVCILLLLLLPAVAFAGSTGKIAGKIVDAQTGEGVPGVNVILGGNRVLQTGTSDMTVPLQFVNGLPDRQEQLWTPWPPQQDSIAVWVRVNTQGWEGFNSATQKVGVHGTQSQRRISDPHHTHQAGLHQHLRRQ